LVKWYGFLGVSAGSVWILAINIQLSRIILPAQSFTRKHATINGILVMMLPVLSSFFWPDAEKSGNISATTLDVNGKILLLSENDKSLSANELKFDHRIYNSVLNPEIWNGDVLKPEVVDKMLKVANAFYKDTELNVPIEDIYFLGSTAGYNWTPTSDMDLHILVDFSKIDPNKELVKKYVDALKNKWNQEHDIHIGDHQIEVYIQDINDVNRSQSVYSVLNNKWVKKPNYQDIQVDKETIKKKYSQYVEMINKVINQGDVDLMKTVIKRLYDMREAGLSSGGEYSVENLVFKLLRSTGYISKLRQNVKSVYDAEINKI
jgi:predicted nucleotidyltransferase